MFRTKVTNLAFIAYFEWPKLPQMALLATQVNLSKSPTYLKLSIWGVWKWSYWIKHGPKPGDRHQDQLSRMFRTKVTNLDILLSGQNGHKWHFGHSGQSEVSGNGIIGFPMHKNIVMDTKIKALACSEPKLQIWPFKLILSSQNGHK